MLKDTTCLYLYDDIVRIILQNTSRQALQQKPEYKIIIKNAPMKFLGYGYKIKLLGLMKLEKCEIDSLLSDTKTPLFIKARLGDISAEDSLIYLYKVQKDYRLKKRILQNLFYIGNERVLKFIPSYFNEPYYDNRRGCIAEGIQYQILLGFRLFHPYEKLLNKILADISKNQFFRRYNNDEEVKNYLIEVRKWIKKTYNVEFVHEEPEKPVLRGFCRN